MALLAVRCSALLCRTKPTGEDDDAAKPRRPENTKRETQVLAASIAETTKEKEAAAQHQAHLPQKAAQPTMRKTDELNAAFCGQVERLVVAKLNRLRRSCCARKYWQQYRNVNV